MAQNSDQRVKPWVRLLDFYAAHPMLGNFLLLAPAMVVILLFSIQSTVMLITQRLAIVIATILLAAACAWIITQSEEDGDPSS